MRLLPVPDVDRMHTINAITALRYHGVNKRQRMILREAADILNHISGMPPTNPADTKRLFRAANVGCGAAGKVMQAINCVISLHVDNDIEDAREYLTSARKLLEAP